MRRVIIAGGRDFKDYELLWKEVTKSLGGTFFDEHANEEVFDFKEPLIMQGGAKGADTLAKKYATDSRFSSQLEFPADWDTHGKAAGPIRNEQMAQNADMLIAFWDGKSRGTKNMINNALKYGLEIHVYKY